MFHFLPFAGITLFFFVAIGLRSVIQYLRYGVSGVILFRSTRPIELLRDLVFLMLMFLLEGIGLLFALAPDVWSQLLLFHGGWAAQIAGSLLLFGGLLLTLAAQLEMGASWRIGIDESTRPGLVTTGFYRFCRNPIYFAMLTTLAGFWLLLPTPISLLCILAVWYGLRAQTLEEEAYLLRTYGDEYRHYAARVGRFLPGLGRLEA